jgi:predicted nucleotidyltransferase
MRHSKAVTLEMLRTFRSQVFEAAARYGASNVRVFGSVARREADEQSEADLLVDLQKGRNLFDLGGLLMDLQEILGRRVDLVTERSLRNSFRERVLREALPL